MRLIIAAAGVMAAAVIAWALLAGGEDGGGASRLPSGFEVALQDNAVFIEPGPRYDRDKAFRQLRELNVTWLRATLIWARAVAPSDNSPVAPGKVAWDWSVYDDLVSAARRHGIEVEFTLVGPAPAWAAGDRKRGFVRPDAARYGEFAGAAAAHFRGRVRRYSIWNEPNLEYWLQPQRDAASIYRSLYVAGHAAVKRADPDGQVLIGETAGPAQAGRVLPALSFIRDVTCRGDDLRPLRPCEKLVADGFAHHPYEFRHPPEYRPPGAEDVTIGSVDRLTRFLDEAARAGALSAPDGGGLDVYLTEFGYFARGRRAVPPEVRAEWLPRAFGIARRGYPRVRQMLQYELLAPEPASPSGFFDTALLSADGSETPSFGALREWSRRAAEQGGLAEPQK
jgi:hypothetical protein